MKDQDKINATLNLSSKNITDDSNIFKELFSSYPNVINLDLSDNQLTKLPEDLSPLSKLQFLDIQGNPFSDVNILYNINKIYLNYSLIK
jgi:Leucine-rich repeat (LRR) protein